MINTNPIVRIRRSAVPGKKPTVDQLLLGELGLNTYDAELFTLRSRTGFATDVVRLGAGATVTNILYVTTDGNDNNTGKKLGDAKATIKGAIAAADTGTVIKVSAGSYIEDNPISIPKQVSIVGDSLREVSVTPQNQGDLFYVSNGNYIAEMSFVGPSNSGAIFAFNPVEVGYFDQSPYIQNCTNFIPDSIGLKIDGQNAIGPTKSMVLDSYTQYNQGGIGCSITNEGYAQLVSLFTICNDIAVYCGSGAACDLTNSNSSFGNYALVADGIGPNKYTGVITSTASANSDTFVLNLSAPTYNISTAVYDYKTGVLTATTSSPHKFEVGMGVTIAGLGFTCPSGPGILTYPSGNNGYVFEIKGMTDGIYLDAANLIINNRREIQDKALGAVAVAHSDFYYPGDPSSDTSYRFKDAYRLIQGNKQEIVDKALSTLPIQFPNDFYFPDEPETNPRSRFYDASGLIQRNKQEIVDKSLGAVAIAHSDFYFPGDSQTNARSRYFDAYRLIQNNKDVIVSIAWTNTYNVYPGVATSEAKCKRDLGFFIDAISTDVLTGGNNYSRQFTLQYFDANGNPINNGLQGEEVESNYAFVQARQLMKQAITNTLVGAAYSDLTVSAGTSTYNGGGPVYANTDPLACSDVQSNIDNLVGIVTAVVGLGTTSSLPSPNYGYYNLSVGIGTTSTPGGYKCARDLGYLVDAVATDVFTGGNKYARDFTLQYFDNAGNPITNGLVGETAESITAFYALRDYSKKAVTNQLNIKNLGISSGPSNYGGPGVAHTVYPSGNANSCADVQSNIDNLVGIVTTVIGAGTTTYLSTFSENLGISTTNKCARDLGYFVDAISTDVFIGGNIYAIEFTEKYFTGAGAATTALLGEESQSIYTFNAARDKMKAAITNQLNYKDLTLTADPNPGIGTTSNINPTSCTNVRNTIDTLTSIVTQAVGDGNLNYINSVISRNYGSFLTGESKCRRDIGYIVDAVYRDVRDGTNRNILKATRAYFDFNGNPISNGLVGEVSESVTAFTAVRDLCKKAINNLLNYQDFNIKADPAVGSNQNINGCANVYTNIDNIISIINTALIAGTTSGLPSEFRPSQFTVNVGVSTLPHSYVSGGTVKTNVARPFDGQVVYFGDLFNSVQKIKIIDGGDGYTSSPVVTIDNPDESWGVPAQAIASVDGGKVVSIDLISSGRGYTREPTITISSPNIGINTAKATAVLLPTYYTINRSTEISSAGICTIVLNDNVPYEVGIGTEVPFFKQSRVLASGHSLEYVGSGVTISAALPAQGGVAIQENETDLRNGGLVVFTSTDQSGNFRIGDGVIINQQTGTISGNFYSKSLFSTMTPFILALGGGD